MNVLQAVVNGALVMLMYMALFGILYKVFAIGKEVAEIKDLLLSRNRETPDPYLSHAARIAQAPPREWTVLDPES